MGLFVRNLADVLKTEGEEFVSRVSEEDNVTYDLMFSFLK